MSDGPGPSAHDRPTRRHKREAAHEKDALPNGASTLRLQVQGPKPDMAVGAGTPSPGTGRWRRMFPQFHAKSL